MAMMSRSSIAGLGAAVLLFFSIIICGFFTHSHVLSHSGRSSALCMPGLSIRCEPDDCGSQYVKCGRQQKRQDVPAGTVCYKGALIPVNSRSRMQGSKLMPHGCQERTSNARNSTSKFDLNCNCDLLCYGRSLCVCYCNRGPYLATECTKNGRTYENQQQAQCCCKYYIKRADSEEDVSWSSFCRSVWTEALDFLRVVIRSTFKTVCDSLRDRFTFPPTLLADACCSSDNIKCAVC